MEVLSYAANQILWMSKECFWLIASMGVGIKWVLMTVRCVTFAMLDLIYFIPNVIWYVLSPRIIRRVSYRCSKRTKRKDLAKFVAMMQMADPNFSPSAPQQNRKAPSQRQGSPGLLSRSFISPHNASSAFANLSGGAPMTPQGTLSEARSPLASLQRNHTLPPDGSVGSTSPEATLPEPGSGDDGDLLDRTVKAIAQTSNLSNCSFDETLLLLQQSYHKQKQQQRVSAPRVPEPLAIPPPESDMNFASALATSIARCEDSSEEDEEDEEDLRNLHNRATLDIYLPVPLDSLFHAMDERNKRQMSGDLNFQLKKFPIVISVNGGAWIVGCYFWNFLVARVLASRGYVVFCPDYRNFPQTDLEGMTLDVSDAISWVLRNAGRYNGDLDDVTLVGQSAGAHLTMMSLLSQAHLAGYEAKGGKRSGLPPPSDVAYNVPRYVPRQAIHRYLGLSGIYNIRHLLGHLNSRGLYRHVLYKIAGGKENLPRYSINWYFDPKRLGETGEVLPDNIFDFMPQRMFFLHGDADSSAPTSESANLVYVMRAAQKDLLVQKLLTDRDTGDHGSLAPPVMFKFVLLPGANHTDSIIEEPLAVGNSHLVEYLNRDRELEHEQRAQKLAAQLSGALTRRQSFDAAESLGSLYSPINPPCAHEDFSPALESRESTISGLMTRSTSNADPSLYPCVPVENPDEVLVCPAPHSERPLLLRMASFVCPF